MLLANSAIKAHHPAWQLSQARSNSEITTTLDGERDTRLGLMRLIIDLNFDGSCQLTFQLNESPQTLEPLFVEWRDRIEQLI